MLAIAAITSRQTVTAQITLEHTYDSASAISQHHGQLYIMDFEIEGEKYIKVNRASYKIELYNLDHSIFKIMDIPTLTDTNYYTTPQILYVTEHLFNNDNLIEYMLVYLDTNNIPHTKIFNELGSTIFSADTAGPFVEINAPQKQFPIYNTANGTKMILSFESRADAYFGNPCYSNVYSLPGMLTTSAPPINYSTGNELGMDIYPNPSNGSNSMIEFHLPQGVSTGEIVVYNTQGAEMKRYKVDNTFHNLLISNSELHSGTYFYQLFTSNAATGAKKMIVVK